MYICNMHEVGMIDQNIRNLKLRSLLVNTFQLLRFRNVCFYLIQGLISSSLIFRVLNIHLDMDSKCGH
jgi:hypothetical protein